MVIERFRGEFSHALMCRLLFGWSPLKVDHFPWNSDWWISPVLDLQWSLSPGNPQSKLKQVFLGLLYNTWPVRKERFRPKMWSLTWQLKTDAKKKLHICSEFPEIYHSKSWSNLLDSPYVVASYGTICLALSCVFLQCTFWPVSIKAYVVWRSTTCLKMLLRSCWTVQCLVFLDEFVTLGCKEPPFVLHS